MKKDDIIEVAELPLAYDEPQKSKKCIMLGWGDTKGTGLADVLKEVEIPIVSNEQAGFWNLNFSFGKFLIKLKSATMTDGDHVVSDPAWCVPVAKIRHLAR